MNTKSQTDAESQARLRPDALRVAPALIESVFPARKVSCESLRERKAGSSQTLTGLGSYRKGRKPLFLARAVLWGCLLPATEDPLSDLAVYEALLGVDEEGLARRAEASGALTPEKMRALADYPDPGRFFARKGWKRGLTREQRLEAYKIAFGSAKTKLSYEQKAEWGKRPEELDPEWLYGPAVEKANAAFRRFGVNAASIRDLAEQLGILRFGARARVGDAFCGGGSIPFEAARLGCPVRATDVNPIACMLAWGAFNVSGCDAERARSLNEEQSRILKTVEQKLLGMGFETDAEGNRAKNHLYCVEARDPETGWMVPLLPSRVVSAQSRCVARLIPDPERRRFNIEIASGVGKEELKEANLGTVRSNAVEYEIGEKRRGFPISKLRGRPKSKKTDGAESAASEFALRPWALIDFKPRIADVFHERLYAVQWLAADGRSGARARVFYAAPTAQDLEKEKRIEVILAKNIAAWQRDGLIPDMPIETGSSADQALLERGWTHWHHMFNPRQLLTLALLMEEIRKSPESAAGWLLFAKILNFHSKLCRWLATGGEARSKDAFCNQALNPLYNYGSRDSVYLPTYAVEAGLSPIDPEPSAGGPAGPDAPGAGKPGAKERTDKRESSTRFVGNADAKKAHPECDIWITDPPYGDSVNDHVIAEYFVAWLRKNPPEPFQGWDWEAKRNDAIFGSGEAFRNDMSRAFGSMSRAMPEHGMQCAMFTNPDAEAWANLTEIFWRAGLTVKAAWRVSTETASQLKRGAHIQGTALLFLRKRPKTAGAGKMGDLLRQAEILAKRRATAMLRLRRLTVEQGREAVLGPEDLSIAGYAAALQALTERSGIELDPLSAQAALGDQSDGGEAPPQSAKEMIDALSERRLEAIKQIVLSAAKQAARALGDPPP